MMITLLLDLDNTLLDNSMDTFLPPYIQGLAKRMAPYVQPDLMVKNLLAATAQMTENTRPDRTLKQVFDSAFYPALSVEQALIDPVLKAYYSEDYPQIKALTHPIPGASQMVSAAVQRGYRIAIATNPLFPRTAIDQRISWAGIDQYPLALVPSYESFHFTKPHPAYLAEFLAQMGWPDDPVVMVGDDLENDLPAAKGMGIKMYWVDGKDTTEGGTMPDATGPIEGLLEWLDQHSLEEFLPDYSSPTAMLAILSATPAAMSSLVKDLLPSAWQRTSLSGNGEWNLTEIACHLRDTEFEVNLPRTKKVIENHAPFLAGIDTDAWVYERQYAAQNGEEALQSFIRSRMQLLEMLNNQPSEVWQRPARHAIFGPTTLKELIGIICKHDQLHIQQAWQAIY